MIQTQALRTVPVALPGAQVNNGAVTTLEVDTKPAGRGFALLTYVIIMGATTAPLTTLKATETDTSGSGYTDVPGAAFGGTYKDGVTANPILPDATTSNQMFSIQVQLRGTRKRFQKLSIAVGNSAPGAYIAAFAILSRGSEEPSTATLRGFASEILL